MNIVITGANGFIGKNLIVRLEEYGEHEIHKIYRGTPNDEVRRLIQKADFIFHLAGVNRPKDKKEFFEGNVDFTKYIVDILNELNLKTPILFTSSSKATENSDYGLSKKMAEEELREYCLKNDIDVYCYRLPNVFGKWCMPNYNSVVATFAYNIQNELPISISDEKFILNLVYIDDVIKEFIQNIKKPTTGQFYFLKISVNYQISLGNLAKLFYNFKENRTRLLVNDVGKGIIRALYSTYLSYLRPNCFSYKIPSYGDDRGVFAEVVKTHSSGQFSFFTAKKGVTRGQHYHHTKTEKFLVIKGHALFSFRHVYTNEYFELNILSSNELRIVETIPGWVHDITNIGDEEMIVMLWANEIFDNENPDTYPAKVNINEK